MTEKTQMVSTEIITGTHSFSMLKFKSGNQFIIGYRFDSRLTQRTIVWKCIFIWSYKNATDYWIDSYFYNNFRWIWWIKVFSILDQRSAHQHKYCGISCNHCYLYFSSENASEVPILHALMQFGTWFAYLLLLNECIINLCELWDLKQVILEELHCDMQKHTSCMKHFLFKINANVLIKSGFFIQAI